MQPILEKSDIENIIPHRDPMLLLDNVLAHSNEEITCSKLLKEDDPVFKGHFETNPIYPGVYLIEGIAQAGAVKVNLDQKEGTVKGNKYFILKVDNAKFKHPAYPKDIVEYKVSTETIGGYHIMNGKAIVNSKVIATAKITAMVK